MAAGGSHLSCPLPVSMCEFGGLLPAEATRDGAGIFYPYDIYPPCKLPRRRGGHAECMPTCGGCSKERPRTGFSARQLKNGADRRRCKHCVPPDGIESNTQKVKRGRPPKAAEELAVQRKTWRFIIEGVTCDEWCAKAAACCYVKKLAFRSIPASGEARARVEGFVGLSADKSARQLEEELGPAHWDHAEGSEWAQVKADLSFEVVLPLEDADGLVRRGVPRDLRVQPDWVSRNTPNLEQFEAEPAAITPGGQHATRRVTARVATADGPTDPRAAVITYDLDRAGRDEQRAAEEKAILSLDPDAAQRARAAHALAEKARSDRVVRAKNARQTQLQQLLAAAGLQRFATENVVLQAQHLCLMQPRCSELHWLKQHLQPTLQSYVSWLERHADALAPLDHYDDTGSICDRSGRRGSASTDHPKMWRCQSGLCGRDAATAALAFHVTPIDWRLEFARPWLNEWQVQQYATFEAECRWEQEHGTLDGFSGRSWQNERYERVNAQKLSLGEARKLVEVIAERIETLQRGGADQYWCVEDKPIPYEEMLVNDMAERREGRHASSWWRTTEEVGCSEPDVRRSLEQARVAVAHAAVWGVGCLHDLHHAEARSGCFGDPECCVALSDAQVVLEDLVVDAQDGFCEGYSTTGVCVKCTHSYPLRHPRCLRDFGEMCIGCTDAFIAAEDKWHTNMSLTDWRSTDRHPAEIMGVAPTDGQVLRGRGGADNDSTYINHYVGNRDGGLADLLPIGVWTECPIPGRRKRGMLSEYAQKGMLPGLPVD